MPDTNEIMLSRSEVRLLRKAFEKLLRDPPLGAVVFCRCLRPEFVEALAATKEFTPALWDVRAVTETDDPASRQIRSDQALALREGKGDGVLLLVDAQRAGAGMDGIYSASREITEADLFDHVQRIAKSELGPAVFAKAELALKQARKVGERRAISRWQEFEFLSCVAENNAAFGQSLSCLGLWPIDAPPELIEDKNLYLSARVVERLLLGSASEKTPAGRVTGLLLQDSSPSQEQALEGAVRDAARRPVIDVLRDISGKADLWLNRINPGFLSQNLQEVMLTPWRATNRKIQKWSGLTGSESDDVPQFVLNREVKETAKQPKLEVRFSTEPVQLQKGSVEFRVSVMAGDEELAWRQLSHSGKNEQSVKFTLDDFQDLPDESQFEACVRLSALGVESVEDATSEEFLLRFSDLPEDAETASNNSKRVRSLVDGAIQISDEEAFDEDTQNPSHYHTDDAKGLVIFRSPNLKSSFAVSRPTLIGMIEQRQVDYPGIGRWSVRVRADGTRVGAPEFQGITSGTCAADVWDKLLKTVRKLREETRERGGFWARIWSGNLKPLEDAISAWTAALEHGPPELALAETIEVQSMSGQTVGLIVLPSHPLRLAWHQAYDQLARHARYEQQHEPKRIIAALEALSAEHVPSILPGLQPNQRFVFADTLGFQATAMVSDQDREPKAAVARMLKCLGWAEPERMTSGGLQISHVLAREVTRYIDFHNLAKSSNGLVLLHALRPGDSATVARALGTAFKANAGTDDDDQDSPLRFNLELFPADPKSDVTGSFLVDLVERHRTGAAGIAAEDRWMLQSQTHPSGLTFPRLRWARKDDKLPTSAAHLAVAFDSFQTEVAFVQEDEVKAIIPLHVYGLIANPQRSFQFAPETCWRTWMPVNSEGIKHPAKNVLTDRLNKLNRVIFKTVVRQAGRPASDWPVLQTRLSPDQQDDLRTIHHRADWVVTVDRNAGVEFFDSPKEEQAIYDAYVIDCVPERNDLGSLQMITSTTKTDEVRALLDDMLAAMSLSSSRRNCEFLVNQLKALSGRMAMRLTSVGNRSSELIALALLQASCAAAGTGEDKWLSLKSGFFVPVDDVSDLAPAEKNNGNSAAQPVPAVRSDLIYVSMPSRGGLSFVFVEVKYRRHLRVAREPQLVEQIAEQAEGHRRQWLDYYFDVTVPEIVAAVRRSRLMRAMQFYLEKARRHSLDEMAYQKLRDQLDRLIRDGAVYRISEPDESTRGYVFCPEMSRAEPELISRTVGGTSVMLFGPSRLPDLIAGFELPPPDDDDLSGGIAEPRPKVPDASQSSSNSESLDPDSEGEACQTTSAGDEGATPADESVVPGSDAVAGESAEADRAKMPRSAVEPESSLETSHVARIILGTDAFSSADVEWQVTSKANPHLMIVGLPGMGKTEALLNICQQLVAQSITPIVFSYHPDIDERLAQRLGDVQLLDHQQLGFNPMHVDQQSPHSHIDNAGMLRDIFAAMFPDLGDVQLERIRSAIRQSYTRLGWGEPSETPHEIPEFRAFFSLLQQDPKPDAATKNILARLNELNDYSVFETAGAVRSLLSSTTPSVLRIHATQNDGVQRAVAMLTLYNIYKEMFRRGVQSRITHAVVFDEAHRASRLRLIPRLAAECRKFGLSLVLASQSARDFDPALYSQIASYLLLRMTEQDANVLAKNITTSDQARRVADRLKQLERYHALFFREGLRQPSLIALSSPS